MRLTLGLLCALCAFAGAFAARPIDLSQEEKFESLVPAVEEHSELTDFAQSTRSLLQTYPPPSPLNEVSGPLNNQEGVSPNPIQVTGGLRIPAANSTQREGIMSSILEDIRANSDSSSTSSDEAIIRKSKQNSRRLLSGFATAERLLDDALNAAPDSVSGEIRMFITRTDGVVDDDLDFEINLFVPDDLSDADRQANSDSSGDSVRNTVDDQDVRQEWQNALSEGVASLGLSQEEQDQLNQAIQTELSTGGIVTENSVTADPGSGATTVKAGLLGLFVSVAAVLLLA